MLEMRRLGAFLTDGGAVFRVYCDKSQPVRLHIEGQGDFDMVRDGDHWNAQVAGVHVGARYGYFIGDKGPFPDPASRRQPDGPHHLSAVVDPSLYDWSDTNWQGVNPAGQVIYEFHVGTFTPDGTWRAAVDKLSHLKQLGVTLLEMMPVCCFPGRFGWGYDGVHLFAPYALYGTPDDLRAFIDAAHAHGIGVIHDVVYNHFGPDGNYLACFSERYFTTKYENEWGDALDYESPGAPMRELMLQNCRYWIEDFHFDGLRFDATQSIFDESDDYVVGQAVRLCRSATDRSLVFVAENEPQDSDLVRHQGVDILWNDDFHHSAEVAATGRNPAYYEDHEGHAQEFVSAAKHGFLFQGQTYHHQSKRRGSPALDLESVHFANFLQNHDQVANNGFGRRIHQCTSLARLRALTALFLLMPGTPMLFQGQEFCASAPFLYFADHHTELAEMVARGRMGFLEQFEHLSSPDVKRRLLRPDDPAAFEQCKLDWSEASRNESAVVLHRDLIALRRSDPVLSGEDRIHVDGSVLTEHAFLLRYIGRGGEGRLLFFNFGQTLCKRSIADPLVAPVRGRAWRLIWSSEWPTYGGEGVVDVETPAHWFLPADSAMVLTSAQ